MRLLMVSPSSVPAGMENILRNLAVGLPALGIEPEVLALQRGPLVEWLQADGVPVESIDAGRLREPVQIVKTVRLLDDRLRSGGFDVVYSNMPKAHLYAAGPAMRRRVPALWCQAGLPTSPHWMDRAATAFRPSGVIALSRAATAAQRTVRPQHSVYTMSPGIDLSRFKVRNDPGLRAEHGIPPDATLISLIGRLEPWKGQREFLHAAAILAGTFPRCRFAIVGGAILGWEGDYPDQLSRLATELGIDDRVIFTGHTDEAGRWMAASDVVVNASAAEPFGVVIIEAMATGCPVVAVAAGGPLDIMEQGESGLLCPTNHPEDLAAAIALLVRDDGARQRMGELARARAEAAFSRESMTQRFAEIIHSVVDGTAT